MDPRQNPESRWLRIQAKMEKARASLCRGGALVVKRECGASAWYLRFNANEAGRRRQRSIYVGSDPILIEQVRRQLEHVRTVARWERELERAGPKIRRLLARLKRPHCELKGRRFR
jgi:hypothetical protein